MLLVYQSRFEISLLISDYSQRFSKEHHKHSDLYEYPNRLHSHQTHCYLIYPRWFIKTFEDAVNAIGEDHPLVAQYKAINNAFKEEDNNLHLFAYTRLTIIAEALNEGWRPEYTEDEYRYYPWFGLYTQEEYDDMDDDDKERCRFVGRSGNNASAYGGLVYADAYHGSAHSYTNIGSRLAFKSRDLAIYCGKQFIDIWIN